MAAIIKIVPQKDWEVLKKYLNKDEGCVLIPEAVLHELPEEGREKLMGASGHTIEYDYGGDADVWLDLIVSPEAYFLREFLQEDGSVLNGMDALRL